jgi:transketolase
MEYKYQWHGIPPDSSDVPGAPPKGKQAAEALKELRSLGGRITGEHE